MSQQEFLESYRRLVLAKEDAAHLDIAVTAQDEQFRQAVQAKIKASLAERAARMRTLLNNIDDPRTLMVIHRYYVMGMTDPAIGHEMHLSKSRVNQLRLRYLRSLLKEAG